MEMTRDDEHEVSRKNPLNVPKRLKRRKNWISETSKGGDG